MTALRRLGYIFAVGLLVLLTAVRCQSQSLWDLAKENRDVLKISTLFTAQNVREHLASDEGINKAIDWCKKTGVTHVFIETFRDNYTAKRKILEHARNRFKADGFEVSGCITPTRVGKVSTGWGAVGCYTDRKTRENLQEIFEYAASIFDEIMIDDFLFINCECDECKKARGKQSWADYRCDLMVKMSREQILGPAKAVNPEAKIIIKYPQWYDKFHDRGYEVVRQTADYDKIWVGTETRDYESKRWGRKVQYESYYIMRWLGEIGGRKTGGGWFDPYGTTENTYAEQARQTVLADAKEMLLFCYGSLLRETGPANVRKLRTEIPRLFELAGMVRDKPIKGVYAPKPPNSDAYDEAYVFDFVGMMGLPLVPTAKIQADAKAAFFAVHAIKDPAFLDKLKNMLDADKPVLITDGLAKRLSGVNLGDEHLTVLELKADPHRLLKLTQRELKTIRDKLLKPFGMKFDAPNKVALYLFGEDCLAVENFNDESIDATFELPKAVKAQKTLVLPVAGSVDLSCKGKKLNFRKMTPRTLVAVEY